MPLHSEQSNNITEAWSSPHRKSYLGPYGYDVLKKTANTIRVLSFEGEQPKDTETLYCRLETVDLESWNHEYAQWYDSQRDVFNALQQFTNIPGSTEILATLCWRRGDFAALAQSMQDVADTSRHMPEFLKTRTGFLQHRFTWGDYFALSYVWGDEERSRGIFLNGFYFPVRPNLYNALRRMRDSMEMQGAKLKVWIDAICINQANLRERTSQVSKMGTIYSRAMCVRAWLGEPLSGTEGDFAKLHEIMDLYLKTRRQDPAWAVEARRNEQARLNNMREPVQRPDLSFRPKWSLADVDDTTLAKISDAFWTLLAHPYWRRLWVTQEIALAPSLVFWYGNSWFSGLHLRMDYELHLETTGRGIHSNVPVSNLATERYQVAMKILRDDSSSRPVLEPYMKATLLARHSLATDPRDKVYGLLGMLRSGISQLIEVNYSPRVSVEDVFKQYTMAGVEFSKNPALRAAFDISEKQLCGHALPTWAIDFDGPRQPADRDTLDRLFGDVKPWTAMKGDVKFCRNNQSLHCQGFLIDAVAKLGPVFGMYEEDGSKMTGEATCLEDIDLPRRVYLSPSSSQMHTGRLSVSRILLQDPHYDFTIGPTPLDLPWHRVEHIATTDLDDVPGSTQGFLSVRQAHHGANNEAGSSPVLWTELTDPTLNAALHTYRPICKAAYANRDFHVGGKRLADWFDSEELYCKDPVSFQCHSDWLQRVTIRGRMMSCLGGLTGTAPAASCPGDIICVFLGSELPVLLRPKGGEYQLIGACYVDGLMLGEAHSWEQDGKLKLEEIVLC